MADPYATKENMQSRFKDVELIDLTNPDDMDATEINDDAMTTALGDAAAEIDAMLSARFKTPLENPPAVLVNICCTIARYNLYSGKSTEEVEKRYENAIKLLKGMSSGDIDAGVATGGGAPTHSSPSPVFRFGMMGGGQ